MPIADRDSLIAAMENSQTLGLYKASLSSQTAGMPCSLWRATGFPGQGAIPGAAATCTKSLTGAWNFTNPGSGVDTYLLGMKFSTSVAGTLWVLDRLSHMGGLSGTVTTAQTVNLTIPASRLADATTANLKWYVEIYTAIGSTSVSATVAYTDETDTSRTCTVSIGGASLSAAGRLIEIVPNSGTRIKSIQTITHATTGTAGSYGITCAKLLGMFPCGQVNAGMLYDYAQCGLPEIPDDACLWFAVLCTTTSSGIYYGNVNIGQA